MSDKYILESEIASMKILVKKLFCILNAFRGGG